MCFSKNIIQQVGTQMLLQCFGRSLLTKHYKQQSFNAITSLKIKCLGFFLCFVLLEMFLTTFDK